MTAVLPELRLRLPGRWWPISLSDHETARAAVRELVWSQLKGDELAKTRIAAERRFLAGLQQAIEGAGHSLYVALTVVPGIPIPMTALVLQPDQELTPAVGVGRDATMDVLQPGLENTDDDGAAGLHRFTAGESEVVRRFRREAVEPAMTDPSGQVDEPLEADTLTAEYWMTIPGTKRFLTVVFSSPLGELEESLVGLFDSIIAATYWSPAACESSKSHAASR